MDDKSMMQDMLLLEKGVCDLYMHGTIEASTTNVQKVFNDALNESLAMQSTLYEKMSTKGWYSADQAEQNKVSSVKQKYSVQA